MALGACGGGGGGEGGEDPACTASARSAWLSDYLDDWYLWYADRPRPAAADHASLNSFFSASLYAGQVPGMPADRWSGYGPTADYDRFYDAGQTLGYGLSVAGRETQDQPNLPLHVRYVEPQSPAAAAGVARGDQVLAMNGVASTALIAGNDFRALNAGASGDTLTLRLRSTAGVDRTVVLRASVYALTPVNGVAVVNSPGGRRLGYVQVKDMLTQAQQPYEAALAQFRAQGVDGLVLDLRYNGGGRISVANAMASYAGVAGRGGAEFARLSFNNRHADRNFSFTFLNVADALSLPRVYVLTGERTCSASELIINGLRPYVDVVTVGDTTCGKPYGFQPRDDACGTTWSVVNFETQNALGVGGYHDGLPATCTVAEDWRQPLGAAQEPLLAEALNHADTGACSVTAQGQRQAQAARGGRSPARSRWLEPTERQGMVDR